LAHDSSQEKTHADHHNQGERLLVLIPSSVKRINPKPPPRSWKVSQIIPIVKQGLTPDGTKAVYLLNLSSLPLSATPQDCLAWVRWFRTALDLNLSLEEAVEIANRRIC
jgi:hypothetical protein